MSAANDDELRDQQLAVVGVAQRVEAADLAPGLEAAGDDQRDDRAQRERGVPVDPLAQLGRIGAREHDGEEHHEPAQPARHRQHVDGVGREWRARCRSPGAGVAREPGREREADRQEPRRRQPPLRQRVLRGRVAGEQDRGATGTTSTSSPRRTSDTRPYRVSSTSPNTRRVEDLRERQRRRVDALERDAGNGRDRDADPTAPDDPLRASRIATGGEHHRRGTRCRR